LSLSEDYVRKLARQGKIESHQPSGKIHYFHRDWLINYALGKQGEPTSELQDAARRYTIEQRLKK